MWSCGGGIAGIAVAYELAVLRGVKNVLILEEREAPLSLTSAYSTECYRNLWAGRAHARAHEPLDRQGGGDGGGERQLF